jgi:hypothetical protein
MKLLKTPPSTFTLTLYTQPIVIIVIIILTALRTVGSLPILDPPLLDRRRKVLKHRNRALPINARIRN